MGPKPGKVETLLYISVWIVLSSIVIVFNKWILDKFPFSITLTTWHMLFATIATQILAHTTTLVDRSVVMDVRLYITAIIPVGMCFSLSLILSNLVYLYLSMSFIQMLKSIGPVATLLACWSIGVRNPEPSVKILVTVCFIVVGVGISSLGELRFRIAGFLIQAAAVICEAYKNALQQSLLSGKGQMSSLTLLYYFAPACTIINSIYILLFEFATLTSAKPSGIGPLIFLANGCLTFALNIASVTVIKKTSSMVLTLSGIPKAILLTLIDMATYRSPMTFIQALGFGIAGAGTYRYAQLTESMAKERILQQEKKLDSRFRGDEECQLSVEKRNGTTHGAL